MLWFNAMAKYHGLCYDLKSWFIVMSHAVVHVMAHCPQYSQILVILPPRTL